MGIHDRNYYRDDQELPGLRPWDKHSMVTNLIIVNVALFVLDMVLSGRNHWLTNSLALRSLDLFEPWNYYRFVTYGFVHDPNDIGHILFNMASLYFLGQAVEQRYGRWEFLRVYLLAIVVGGLVYALLRINSHSPEVFEAVGRGRYQDVVLGASGGVIAVVMLFVFNYPQAQLLIWGIVPVRAWIVGVITVLADMLHFSSRVAIDVHLAGAATAAVYFFGKWDLSFLSFDNFQPRKMFQRRPNLKVHTGDVVEPTSSDEKEADRLLDKIYRDGKDSLTAAEQRFLEEYSRRVRKNRGGP